MNDLDIYLYQKGILKTVQLNRKKRFFTTKKKRQEKKTVEKNDALNIEQETKAKSTYYQR